MYYFIFLLAGTQIAPNDEILYKLNNFFKTNYSNFDQIPCNMLSQFANTLDATNFAHLTVTAAQKGSHESLDYIVEVLDDDSINMEKIGKEPEEIEKKFLKKIKEERESFKDQKINKHENILQEFKIAEKEIVSQILYFLKLKSDSQFDNTLNFLYATGLFCPGGKHVFTQNKIVDFTGVSQDVLSRIFKLDYENQDYDYEKELKKLREKFIEKEGEIYNFFQLNKVDIEKESIDYFTREDIPIRELYITLRLQKKFKKILKSLEALPKNKLKANFSETILKLVPMLNEYPLIISKD